ncbi:hypothetical protein BKA81DRAFT_114752 [Phyllosticta paracitricarpa]
MKDKQVRGCLVAWDGGTGREAMTDGTSSACRGPSSGNDVKKKTAGTTNQLGRVIVCRGLKTTTTSIHARFYPPSSRVVYSTRPACRQSLLRNHPPTHLSGSAAVVSQPGSSVTRHLGCPSAFRWLFFEIPTIAARQQGSLLRWPGLAWPDRLHLAARRVLANFLFRHRPDKS